MSVKPIIGCLALQGAVEVHCPHVEAAGAEFRAVKTPEHFKDVDAFILPGGESTTMLRLIETFGLWDVLADEFARKPVWGICAGSILLAETVYISSSSPRPAQAGLDSGDPEKKSSKAAHIMDPVRAGASNEARQRDDVVLQKSFGLVPVSIQRNAYGRQLDSHHAEIGGYAVSFIRAPVITDAGKTNVKAVHNGDPVWLTHDKYMLTTFHPELTLDFPSPMHQAFVDLAGQST